MGSLKEGTAPDQPMGTKKGGQTRTSPSSVHVRNMQQEQSSQEPATRATWRRERRVNQNEDTSESKSGPTLAGVPNSDWPPLPTSLKSTKNAIKHVQGQLVYALESIDKCEAALMAASTKALSLSDQIEVLRKLEATQAAAPLVVDASSSEDDEASTNTKAELAKAVCFLAGQGLTLEEGIARMQRACFFSSSLIKVEQRSH